MLPKVQFLKTYILFVGIVSFGFIYLFSGDLIHQTLTTELIFPVIPPQLMVARQLYVEHPNQSTEVEVLNGCGVANLAARTTEFLRSKHFDVVFEGNMENQQYQHTLIILRNEKVESLIKIANSFNIDYTDISHIQITPDESLCLDITVILGADYIKFAELTEHINANPI